MPTTPVLTPPKVAATVAAVGLGVGTSYAVGAQLGSQDRPVTTPAGVASAPATPTPGTGRAVAHDNRTGTSVARTNTVALVPSSQTNPRGHGIHATVARSEDGDQGDPQTPDRAGPGRRGRGWTEHRWRRHDWRGEGRYGQDWHHPQGQAWSDQGEEGVDN